MPITEHFTSTWWLAPTPLLLLASLLVAIVIPLLLHFILYRHSSGSTLPAFMLLGSSGSGKTALQTVIERGKVAATCTSQAPSTMEASVPVKYEIASNRYRSVKDPSTVAYKRFLIIDTPGHGKLRHHAFQMIQQLQNLKGLIFVVDATGLNPDSSELRDVAEYLHDILLVLQTSKATVNASTIDFPVMIVLTKLDLFTALPTDLAKTVLEAEVSRVRVSRSKGMLDANTGADLSNDEQGWLGQGGEGAFTFNQMKASGIVITFVGNQIVGNQQAEIEALWTWVGHQL